MDTTGTRREKPTALPSGFGIRALEVAVLVFECRGRIQ